MTKKQEIQAEIDEFSALLNEPNVPEDEKEFAKSEITRLQALLDKIPSTPKSPKKKLPAKYKEGEEVYFFWNKEAREPFSNKKTSTHKDKQVGKIVKVTYDELRNTHIYNVKTPNRFFLTEATDISRVKKRTPSGPDKTSDPRCDDLLKQYNKRKERQKQSAKKSENTPAVKKDEKAVVAVATRIKKHFKAGELTKPQIESLIKELSDKIKELRKLLKSHSPAPNKKAKGGSVNSKIVVTPISSIPGLQEKVDAGQVTYRGLGMGKLSDDFYKVAGETGTRIKVDGKEYFITDTDFRKLNWDFENNRWLNKIKFSAPFRKHKHGGTVGTEDIDLFEYYESLPQAVQDVLAEHSDDDQDYETLGELQQKLEALGYTFDYGLDAVPYDLRKMSAKGSISVSDIVPNAQFKTSTGIVWVIDEVGPDPDFGTAVRTSMKGGSKGNYRDSIEEVVLFLNEENAVKMKACGGSMAPTKYQKNKVTKVMREYKAGKLHSGSKKGPVVKSRKQAVAIALSESNLSKKTTPDEAGWKHKRKHPNK